MTQERHQPRETGTLKCPYCHESDFASTPARRCTGCLAWQHAACVAEAGKCGSCGAAFGEPEPKPAPAVDDVAWLKLLFGGKHSGPVGLCNGCEEYEGPLTRFDEWDDYCPRCLKAHQEWKAGKARAAEKPVEPEKPRGPHIILTPTGYAVVMGLRRLERRKRIKQWAWRALAAFVVAVIVNLVRWGLPG